MRCVPRATGGGKRDEARADIGTCYLLIMHPRTSICDELFQCWNVYYRSGTSSCSSKIMMHHLSLQRGNPVFIFFSGCSISIYPGLAFTQPHRTLCAFHLIPLPYSTAQNGWRNHVSNHSTPRRWIFITRCRWSLDKTRRRKFQLQKGIFPDRSPR